MASCNAESFFVGRTLRWLKNNTDWEFVLSYADGEQGHTGVIYRAANFKYLGLTSPGKTLDVDGTRFHIRTLSMIDRPYGVEINRRYKAKDPGVKIITTKPKHIFTYIIKKKKTKIIIPVVRVHTTTNVGVPIVLLYVVSYLLVRM